MHKFETHQMHTDNDCEPQEYSLFHTQGFNCFSQILITVKVNGVDLTMELDTGVTLSLISERTYKDLFPAEIASCLQITKAQPKTYTGEAIKPHSDHSHSSFPEDLGSTQNLVQR